MDIRKFRVMTHRGLVTTVSLPELLVQRACTVLGDIFVVGPLI